MKTASALDIAKLFYNRVYSRFGLYDKIISDRGPQFASLFAKELGKLLGYSLSLSTAYHPQTDGETECVNQELEVYLRTFCQNDPFSWADHLSTAEFTHNHRPHSITNVSPFYLMYGYEPRPLPSIISKTLIPAAEDRIKELSEARKEAVAAHDLARKAMKERNSGKFVPFAKGDKVWLEARNLKCLYENENRKFAPKWEGPFLISEVLSPVTYCLSIPLKWKIHNTFHASLLSPYHENDVHGPNYMRSPPDLIGTEEEYEVEAIITHRGSARNSRTSCIGKDTPWLKIHGNQRQTSNMRQTSSEHIRRLIPKPFPPELEPSLSTAFTQTCPPLTQSPMLAIFVSLLAQGPLAPTVSS